MSKKKKSGPAIFMYCVIAAGVVISALSFTLYYTHILKNSFVFWTTITAFTITYHLWGRIIMGNVTKLFKIRYDHPWFKERKFEKKLYKLLRVRKWKEKVLTYDPEAFSVEKHTLPEIATTMSKAETDHWINELISLSTLLFAIIWGELWIFAITAFAAMIFDAQFIVVQRYNRPRVIKLMERRQKRV